MPLPRLWAGEGFGTPWFLGASRELYDTHFALEHPGHVQGHQHGVHHWIFVTSGRNRCIHQGRFMDLLPGRFFWASPGELHTYQPLLSKELEYRQWTFTFRDESEPSLTTIGAKALFEAWTGIPGVDVLDLSVGSREKLKVIHETMMQAMDGPGASIRMTSNFMQVLSILVDELKPKENFEEDLLAQIRRKCIEQPGLPWTLDEFSRITGHSCGWLCKLWRERWGKSPIADLQEIRLEAAAHWLLASDLPIKEISTRLGFQTVQYFSRTFSRHHRMPPHRYRVEVGR